MKIGQRPYVAKHKAKRINPKDEPWIFKIERITLIFMCRFV